MPDYSFDDLLAFQAQGPGSMAADVRRRARSDDEGDAPKTPEDIRREKAQQGQKQVALAGYAADVAAEQAKDAKTRATFGTADPARVREMDMPGSPLVDPEAFNLLAASDKDKASAVLDSIDKASGRGPASQEGIRRGTQATEHGDIPYFTNLPGDAGASGGPMAGVRDLAPYTPGGSPNPGNAADPLAGITDPDQRAVARKVADAREQVRLAPDSPTTVGKKIAAGLPSAMEDITNLGEDGATAKWMQEVTAGKRSLSEVEGLQRQTKDAVAARNEIVYSKARETYFNLARGRGVTGALKVLADQEQKGALGLDPVKSRKLQAELQSKARSMRSPAVKAGGADLFLPATVADAAQWETARGQTLRKPDQRIEIPGETGPIDMPDRPASMINPGGQAPSPQEATGEKVQSSTKDLLDTVTGPTQVGKAAKSSFDYTIGGGRSPQANEMAQAAAERKAANPDLAPSGVPYPDTPTIAGYAKSVAPTVARVGLPAAAAVATDGASLIPSTLALAASGAFGETIADLLEGTTPTKKGVGGAAIEAAVGGGIAKKAFHGLHNSKQIADLLAYLGAVK